MFVEWDELDEAATNEGIALVSAFKIKRPRQPHGVNKEDIIKDSRKRDILKELGVINGRVR